MRPTVQGAAVVLENQTGRILAMAGGFSYPLSQLNRVTQSQRQPGSAIKPVSYLAALARGLQPNTLVRDEPITLPPIGGTSARTRPEDYWTPRNYDGGGGGIMTLRRALELSRNLATANLLEGGIDVTPALSLDRICALAMEAQIYRDCIALLPVRPGRAAGAADRSRGVLRRDRQRRRAPVAARDRVDRAGRQGDLPAPGDVPRPGSRSADGVAFYQLKTMLQGVLQRGTATRIAGLAPYVAGKTGTTDGENDVWFVGFTNEVTVAVWVGYDNADGRRRTLGGGATGGSVAVPIFEPIIQAVWAHHAPRTTLRGPSPETRKFLVATRVDADSTTAPDFTRDGARRGTPGGWSNTCGATRAGSRSIPSTGWWRATTSVSTDPDAGATIAAGPFEFFFGGSRLRRLSRRGGPRRAPPAFGLECAPAAAAAVPTAALAGGARLLMASRGLGAVALLAGLAAVFCGGGGAGIRDRRDAVRHPAAGRAAQAAGDRLFRPAGRRPGRSGGRLHPLRGLGEGAARSSSNSSASIPATPSRTSTSSSTAPRRRYRERLHMYVAEARFVIARRAGIAQARAARDACRSPSGSTPRSSTSWRRPADQARPREARVIHNQHPQRKWCEGRAVVICLRSTYKLEGRLPVGIQLANKIREGSRRISDTLEFDSELTVLSAAEVGELGLAKLTAARYARRPARSSRASSTSTR